MNKDVLQHVIKIIRNEMRMCEWGNLIHDGGKEDALQTYGHILQMLQELMN